jgi:hypothetical protein
MTLQTDIDWYREGERDRDFVQHLADELLEKVAALEAERDRALDLAEQAQAQVVRAVTVLRRRVKP